VGEILLVKPMGDKVVDAKKNHTLKEVITVTYITVITGW
jgi:hypothetical protein